MRYLTHFLWLILLPGCQPGTLPPNPTISPNQHGFVSVFAASRGSYQYVINLDSTGVGEELYVINFPDSLKHFLTEVHNSGSTLAVVFGGTRLTEKKTLYKPGPGDTPFPVRELTAV